jgi:hypothetical protein
MNVARNRLLSKRNQLKTFEKDLGGRDRLEFGTVRPRVQIPGPRPWLAQDGLTECRPESRWPCRAVDRPRRGFPQHRRPTGPPARGMAPRANAHAER